MHDYADHFALATDAVATPERWARAMLGNVPNLGELFIWSVMLQLRLSRKRSSSTVAGWRIVDRDDERIRLEATSWFMTADLVVRAVDGRVSLDTLIHYDRWAAHIIWPPLSAVHRALVPGVLRKAAARIQLTARPDRGEKINTPAP